MIALILSYLLLAYIIVPGVLFNVVLSMFIPLRNFQWTRTQEITFSVISIIIPFAAGIFLIHGSEWAVSHFFQYPPLSFQRDHHYGEILLASVNQRFFDDNYRIVWEAILRDSVDQACVILCFYGITVLEAIGVGKLLRNYGRLRKGGFLEEAVTKLIVPKISEWHAMFTAFVFPPEPKRQLVVELLTSEGTYRGEIGDYHVNHEGSLTGLLIRNARRFNKIDYSEDTKAGKVKPIEDYWRMVIGDALYVLASKISNINLSYFREDELKAAAEDALEKLKIDGRISVKPAQLGIDDSENRKLRSGSENPSICTHCLAKGLSGRLPRIAADTPLVSRTDGSTYHLFLQFGPRAQPGNDHYLLHFRYAQDFHSVTNEPVIVRINAPLTPDSILRLLVEDIADQLAGKLKDGMRLAPIYKYAEGKMSAM